jgi:hypothetical protein
MDEYPSTGTRGDTYPDPTDHFGMFAVSEAHHPGKVTLSDSITPEQRRAFTRKVWGYRLAARRQATGTPVPVIATTASRPRERRDRTGRSSARSGDSPSDEPPPPGDWHWIQPAAWQPLDPIAGDRMDRRSRRDRQLVAA